MSRVIASVSAEALVHNIEVVRQMAPTARVSAVVKDNAYGHGLECVVEAIESRVDGFSVATLEEGVSLRSLGTKKPIWIFTGFQSVRELRQMAEFALVPVVHSNYQIELLRSEDCRVSVIVEVDTGLGRLGFKTNEIQTSLHELSKTCKVELVLSHFSSADQLGAATSLKQMKVFDEATRHLEHPRSIANSGGIIDSEAYHLDWIRPGLMLYGVSPFRDVYGEKFGLRPALKLSTRIIAVRKMRQGDTIGYGASWRCPEDMLVGILRCGYGDGYPRVISAEARVSLNGCYPRIIGRVSMDSLAIDLRDCKNAEVGSEVVLWGPDLPIENVAEQCWTIPNELLTRMTGRVQRTAL